jgi:CheY-like chemotaxis protein
MTTILLVEDNEMNRDMLSRRLERRGYNVLTAEDGQQAVDTCKQSDVDLVLMDMGLPVKDGWTASKEIKTEVSASLPVIALTAHALAEDRKKALNAGCDDYATKPIDFPALLDLIQRHL